MINKSYPFTILLPADNPLTFEDLLVRMTAIFPQSDGGGKYIEIDQTKKRISLVVPLVFTEDEGFLWRYMLAYEDAPHVAEESAELAELVAGKPYQLRVKTCNRRIVGFGEQDWNMDFFDSYTQLIDAILPLENAYVLNAIDMKVEPIEESILFGG